MILILTSGVNSRFKHDATGAFIPESTKLHRLTPGSIHIGVDLVKQKPIEKINRIAHVCDDYITHETSCIYFFGHGWRTGFQGGFQSKSGAALLAFYLKKSAPHLKRLVFYACSMGKGSDNFLKWLSVDLPDVKIVGHTTAGHTTKNPNVCFYVAGEKTLICPPGSRFRRKWIQELKTDFRFYYPNLDKRQILSGLNGI